LDAVAEHGYRRAYIREIAERVGLTQAGLMHHFRTREHLYQEIIRTRDEHDRDEFAVAPRGVEGFFAVIEHNQRVPGLAQLYAEFSAEASHPEHPAHDFFRERFAYLREALARDVEQAREDGEFGGGVDALTAADLLISAADGLQLRWLIDREIDMVGRLRELWRSLCAVPANHA
jgi:AcrR family transcriptional regulator